MDTVRLPSAGLRGIAFDDTTAYLLMSPNTGLSIPDSSYRTCIVRGLSGLDTLSTETGAYEAGLAFDGTSLWAGGNGVGGPESIYQVDVRSGAITKTLPAGGYHPGGLVWDEEYLWQVDADARQIARIETEEGKISRRFATPGFYPTGLAYDGFHFWCADAATGRIHRIRAYNGRDDGVVDPAIFQRPGEFVTLGWDGHRLWVAAATDTIAVRYDILR